MDKQARESARRKLLMPEHPSGKAKQPTPFNTYSGLRIANGFERVVIGDRGAYIEFTDEQIVQDNIFIPDDQQWRVCDSRWTEHTGWAGSTIIFCSPLSSIRSKEYTGSEGSCFLGYNRVSDWYAPKIPGAVHITKKPIHFVSCQIWQSN